MAEKLKDSFGRDVPVRIANAIAAVAPGFDSAAFVADALDGYDALELTPRARHVAAALRRHLPHDYNEAIAILVASLGPPIETDKPMGMAPFLYAPHVYFVAAYGLDQWDTSMRAQHALTQRFTAEFSIRAFLDREPQRTLAQLREWTRDPSAHVRRLVSEGTRPRLPWAPRLREFQRDPAPVIDLLEQLKDDPSLYVRRSVANNLNDIGKDHPEVLVETCRRWLVGANADRRWLIRHALRSAVKRGDRRALELLGFEPTQHTTVTHVVVAPERPTIGGAVRVTFIVANTSASDSAFNVDLRVHFVKANGGTSPKVFKVGKAQVAAGGAATMSKLVSLRQGTTRTHYPGTHRVEAIVNGDAHPLGSFALGSGGQPHRGRGVDPAPR